MVKIKRYFISAVAGILVILVLIYTTGDIRNDIVGIEAAGNLNSVVRWNVIMSGVWALSLSFFHVEYKNRSILLYRYGSVLRWYKMVILDSLICLLLFFGAMYSTVIVAEIKTFNDRIVNYAFLLLATHGVFIYIIAVNIRIYSGNTSITLLLVLLEGWGAVFLNGFVECRYNPLIWGMLRYSSMYDEQRGFHILCQFVILFIICIFEMFYMTKAKKNAILKGIGYE